jgi:uncharacterized protein
VLGGQTMNPSTAEMLNAVQDSPGHQAIILPNNGNVILAAQQVRLLTDKQVTVIPTQNMAQGVAAAIAFQPDAGVPTIVRAMERATQQVRTAEITTAVRAAKVESLEVRPGQTMALVDGRLTAVGDTDASVVDAVLEAMKAGQGEVLTIYYGADVDETQAHEIEALIQNRLPELQIEIVYGGQPLYQYLLSVE